MKLGDKEARRASITGLVPAYSSTPGRSLRTMSGFQLASVGALPFPLTLTLNETFHNLNRPGLPGGAFRSARKAEIGLRADMRRRGSSITREPPLYRRLRLTADFGRASGCRNAASWKRSFDRRCLRSPVFAQCFNSLYVQIELATGRRT